MDRKETGRQKETEGQRDRETERKRWGAKGGTEDDRTHEGDKGERKKEKRERTMSAD